MLVASVMLMTMSLMGHFLQSQGGKVCMMLCKKWLIGNGKILLLAKMLANKACTRLGAGCGSK